jgi:hypothetical protein
VVVRVVAPSDFPTPIWGTVRIERAVLGDVDGPYGSESTGGWLLCTRGVAIWQMAVLATRLVMAVDESEDPKQCLPTDGYRLFSSWSENERAKLEEGESRPLHQVTVFLDSALTYDVAAVGRFLLGDGVR